ncbi:hypothetical protein A2U01_0064950, partial [Trifolium medium]|nr:hypothetical protein [Trifolium medium]
TVVVPKFKIAVRIDHIPTAPKMSFKQMASRSSDVWLSGPFGVAGQFGVGGERRGVGCGGERWREGGGGERRFRVGGERRGRGGGVGGGGEEGWSGWREKGWWWGDVVVGRRW